MPPRTLQLAQEIGFHRRAWRVQRVACALLGLVVLAALLGAFGGGQLSRHGVDDGHGLHMDYERVARRQARTTVDLFIVGDAPMSAPGTREIRIAGRWLERVRIEEMEPAARETHVQGGALHYRFDVQDGEPLHVRIEAQPSSAGRLDLQVAQPGVAPLRVTQRVLP